MTQNTDVSFRNNSRIHFGLYVTDLATSIRFYSGLFQTTPSKVKADYAKFELDDPSLNLALSQSSNAIGTESRVNHFGIQLKSSDAVHAETQRLQALGFATETEEASACCYAVQDKVWVADPDGNRWELFVVTQNNAVEKSDDADCCSQGKSNCCDTTRVDAEP